MHNFRAFASDNNKSIKFLRGLKELLQKVLQHPEVPKELLFRFSTPKGNIAFEKGFSRPFPKLLCFFYYELRTYVFKAKEAVTEKFLPSFFQKAAFDLSFNRRVQIMAMLSIIIDDLTKSHQRHAGLESAPSFSAISGFRPLPE